MKNLLFLAVILLAAATAFAGLTTSANPTGTSSATGSVSVSPLSKDALWVQDPVGGGGGNAWCSEYIPNYAITCYAADDFELAFYAVIDGIDWYGGYWNGSGAFSSAYVLFFNDAGGVPETDPVYTYGPVAYGDCGETFEWSGPYGAVDSYSIASIDPFYVDPGTTYWVCVYVELNFPPQWGVYDSSEAWGSQIMQQSTYFFGDMNWHATGNGTSWAVTLNGTDLTGLQSTSLGSVKALFN
jgi:hypothetical protein